MKKELTEKQKELINGYWIALVILGVISLVNLFAISAENMKAAAIVNFVFLIIIPVVFILGYIDYRNYKPLGKVKGILYCATAAVSIWITLIHFNVQNYTFLSSLTDESTYNIWVSVLTALYLAIGVVCLSLTLMNSHNRRKQVKYYYLIAAASLISSLFLSIFNYGTYISLFWAPLLLMGINEPIIVDTGMTILELRVIVEYGIFIWHACSERRNRTLKAGEESEYKKPIYIASVVAFSFMLVNVIILPILSACATLYSSYHRQWMLAYAVVELISVVVLLFSGTFIAFANRKSHKFSPIYTRMGIAAIVFALVFLIMDFIPITEVIEPKNAIHAQIINDLFHASVKMAGLLCYTLYVCFNKKLKSAVHALDIEHEEKMSSENYSI